MNEKQILRELIDIVKDLTCCIGPDPYSDFIEDRLRTYHDRLELLGRYLDA